MLSLLFPFFSHKVSTLGKTVSGMQLVEGSTKTVRENVGKREGGGGGGEPFQKCTPPCTPPLCFSLAIFHTAPYLTEHLEKSTLGWSLLLWCCCFQLYLLPVSLKTIKITYSFHKFAQTLCPGIVHGYSQRLTLASPWQILIHLQCTCTIQLDVKFYDT